MVISVGYHTSARRPLALQQVKNIQQRDTGKICFRYMFPQTLKSILNRPPLGFFYHEDLILDKPGKERKRPDVIWPEQQGFKEIRCKINDISIHISLERPCMDLAWR